MVKISEIKINIDSGFFTDRNFSWSDLKPFSIITGINGSGKTQLLHHIANSDHFSHYLTRYIDVDYKPPLQKHANELAGQYNHSLLNEEGKVILPKNN